MRRASWWATAAAATAVAVSLVVRLVHRGAYYPGFDVVGAANGLFLWSTQSKWDAIATVFVHSRTYSAPFPFYSALCALLPGFLASVWPWEHWGGSSHSACASSPSGW